MLIIENSLYFIMFMLICFHKIKVYAVIPIKPLEFKLNRGYTTLSVYGSGATVATVYG